MPARAKRFEDAVSIDPDGRDRAEDGVPVEFPDSWTPEKVCAARAESPRPAPSPA